MRIAVIVEGKTEQVFVPHQEVFRTGARRRSYVKARDAKRILHGEDLLIAADACAELKAFLNTILSLCGGAGIP